MSAQQRRSVRRTSRRHLLVASPHVSGTPYDRRVVLLLAHSPRGTVGVMLNDPSQRTAQRARGDLSNPLDQRIDGKSKTVTGGLLRWAPGQLEAELNLGVWFASSARVEDVVGDHGDLWVDLVRHVGRCVLEDALQVEHFPQDPTIN